MLTNFLNMILYFRSQFFLSFLVVSCQTFSALQKSQIAPTASFAPPKSSKIASVFNVDDEDEPEEMPAECKMRMKNVGR